MKNPYIGHDSQLFGVEEHRLVGGKGDSMRLFQVKNGKGLEFTVSADRCADISRLSFKGENFGYFSPVGYVAPSYYDKEGLGFLKSFTAGFLTTCGLRTVGVPCVDEGEQLPLHGTISNTPASHVSYSIDDKNIVIKAQMEDTVIFDAKLLLSREIVCSLQKNTIIINDTIKNIGSKASPLMMLYHINLGYPLLDESAILNIPSSKVIPRNEHSQKDIDKWSKMQKPEANFIEQCYYHKFEKDGRAGLFNPTLDKGVVISFDAAKLDYLIEWKMMGEKDYVLGIEPANCHADGRDVMRKSGELKFIEPSHEISYQVKIDIVQSIDKFKEIINK